MVGVEHGLIFVTLVYVVVQSRSIDDCWKIRFDVEYVNDGGSWYRGLNGLSET